MLSSHYTAYQESMKDDGTQRGVLQDAGLVEYSTYTDFQLGEAVRSDAQPWLTNYILENNVGPHWEPSYEIWIEFMRKLLSALGVSDDLDRYAANMTRLWNEHRVLSNSFLLKGVKPVLEKLKSKGIKLAAVTNRFDDPTLVLQRDGIMDLFETIEYSNVLGYSKPSPYMLIQVAHKLDVNPLSCAFVGDFVMIDVVAANRAGIIPILLTWRNPAQTEKAPPDTIIIDHIEKLLDLFS